LYIIRLSECIPPSSCAENNRTRLFQLFHQVESGRNTGFLVEQPSHFRGGSRWFQPPLVYRAAPTPTGRARPQPWARAATVKRYMSARWAPSIALVIILIVGVVARAQVVTTLGAGNQSCGTWLSKRVSQDYFVMGDWALGFLSGVAIYGDFKPLEDMDSNAVFYWLDNYCRPRPTDRFTDAVKAFTQQHPK
jgi:hypothetical protein